MLDIISFNELISIKVWKQKNELFYYVAIEYFYYEIHGIYAVQGLGGINEMMVHIKKTNIYATTKDYLMYFSGVKFTS